MPMWLSGWQYRKSHTINGSTVGAVTDYQVRVKVYYGSGPDSGENVYLNSHCRTDFGDVRFTSDDGVTLLSYWIEEKVDGSYAIIWVKVPSIPASPSTTTIYIYYGNASATTTSNATDTFLFFDHFDVDLSKWTVRSGTWNISDSELVSGALDDNQIVTASFTMQNGRLRCKYRISSGATATAFAMMARTPNASNMYKYQDQSAQISKVQIRKRIAGSWTTLAETSKTFDSNSHVMEFTLYGSSLKGNIDGSYSLSATDTSLTGTNPIGFRRGNTESGKNFYVDWVFVANYVEPEPSHGAWGSEELIPYISQDFPAYFIRSGKAQELINKI